MHDAVLVRCRQGPRDLNGQLGGHARRELPARHALAQRLAVQQFRHHIRRGHAVDLGGAYVVHGQDVRMIQRGRGPGFLFEARQPARVHQPAGHHLDRHVASEPCIAGAIHLTHAARAQRRADLIRAEAVPGVRAMNVGGL